MKKKTSLESLMSDYAKLRFRQLSETDQVAVKKLDDKIRRILEESFVVAAQEVKPKKQARFPRVKFDFVERGWQTISHLR